MSKSTLTSDPSIGEIAYVAFFEYSDGATPFADTELLEWDEQPGIVKGAWEAAAEAVAKYLEEEA